MQAFGFWNYSTDFDVQALGLMGRGRRDETKGCNLEKLNCVGQSAFNGSHDAHMHVHMHSICIS